MALLDSEGFGFSPNYGDYVSYGILATSGIYGSNASIATGGPLGDNFLLGSINNGMAVQRVFISGASSFFYGQRLAYWQNANSVIYFLDQFLNEQFHVTFSSAGVISVVRGGTTLGSSALGAIPTGYTWSYVEVGAVISPTSGSVTVRVNGTVVLPISGVNTQNSGSSSLVQVVQWGSGTSSQTPATAHVYFCDSSGAAPWNTFLGDVRVQTVLPVANATVQFSPTGLANNWQNVAQVPPVPGTDYNSDATVGAQDTFSLALVSSTLTQVFGVHLKGVFAKSDAGDRSGATVMQSGAVTDVATGVALGLSPTLLKKMYQADPNTGVQWTKTAVNAAHPGYKVTA